MARPPTPLGRALRLVFFAWLFGAFWANIVGGVVLNRFARGLGASDASFGLLAAIPFLGAAVQLPVSYLIERYGHRKLIFLAGGLLGRLMWLPIAAIPWLLPAGIWWEAFVACYVIAIVGNNTDNPTWISWMADYIPRRIRGRFTSGRTRLGQAVTLLLPLLVGWILDRSGPVGDHTMRVTVSVLLALGSLMGAVDILMHLRVPDVPKPKPAAVPSFHGILLQPLRDANYRRFLAYDATLVFATGFLGQYVWLYFFDVLHATVIEATLLVTVGTTVLAMLFNWFYGPLIDRLGRKPLLIIGGVLIIPGALGWLFVHPGHWFPGYLLVAVSMLGWPASDMARFNVVLSMSESRAGRGSGIAYVAVDNIVCAVSGVLSGVFGSLVAHSLGPAWRGSFLGISLTYHGVLFLASTLFRVLSLLWLVRFEEPRAYATRDAMRYVALAMAANLQFVATAPIRFLRRVGSTTFRFRG